MQEGRTKTTIRFTYNFEINNRPDKSGLYAVMLRLHRKGCLPARLLTGVELTTLKHWNNEKPFGKWIRSSHGLYHTFNTQLEQFYNQTKETVETWLKAEPLTPAQVKGKFDAQAGGVSYKTLALAAIERLRVSNTVKGKKTALNAFIDVIGKDCPLDGINSESVRKFQKALDIKGLNPSTINQYIAALNPIHVSLVVDTGIPRKRAALMSPFIDVETLTITAQPKDDFSLSQIGQLAGVTLKRRVSAFSEKDALNVWLLCYQLAGMRIADLLRLRYSNFIEDETGGVRCIYEMKKNQKILSVPAAHALSTIQYFTRVDAKPTDYLLPFLQNDAPYSSLVTVDQLRAAPLKIQDQLEYDINHIASRVNGSLKALLAFKGFPGKLTVHTARKSLAVHAQQLANAGILEKGAIQTGMAHDSATTTRIYTGREIIRADAVINALFPPK